MTPVYAYVPSRDTDILLAQLWMRIAEDNELGLLFADANALTLSTFFALSTPPHRLFYALDAQGIWLAFWFDPFLGGGTVSAYIRPDHRATLLAAKLAMRLLRAALDDYETLFLFTWVPENVALYNTLGYSTICTVPRAVRGLDCHFCVMTKESTRCRGLPLSPVQ